MAAFASNFGPLEYKEDDVTKLESANFTNLYYPAFEKSQSGFFSRKGQKEFDDLIIKGLTDKWNDNNERLVKALNVVCERFVDSVTPDNPKELYKVFNAEFNNRGSALRADLADIEWKLKSEIKENVTAEMDVPTTTYSYLSLYDAFQWSTAPQKKSEPVDIGSQLAKIERKNAEIEERINTEIPIAQNKIISEYEQDILDTMKSQQNKQLFNKNRVTFFDSLCDSAIVRPEIFYKNGVIYFKHFPYSRGWLEAVLSNVMTFSGDVFKEDDIGRSDKGNNNKQVEMAEFLIEVFMKWDASIIKIFQKGHLGKKTPEEFFDGMENDFKKLLDFVGDGIDGEPNEVRAAKKRLKQAQVEQNVFKIETDTNEIIQNMTDQQRTELRTSMGKFTDFIFGISTDAVLSGVNNTRTVLKREVLEMVSLFTWVAFSVGGTLLLLSMAFAYARRINPVFMPSTEVTNTGVTTTGVKVRRKSPAVPTTRVTRKKKALEIDNGEDRT